MNEIILAAAKVLWDFHRIDDKPQTSDVIIGFGSYDLRVAQYASELYLQGIAPLLLFTGKAGNWTKGLFNHSEAEAFADVAMKAGVPEAAILLETRATNIGENIVLSKALLAQESLSAVLVTKPQTQRRVFATAARQWPEAAIKVSAPATAFEDQPTEQYGLEMLISEMTGDVQRMLDYPAKGFQIAQAVPLQVLEAYEFLIAKGFDNHPA